MKLTIEKTTPNMLVHWVDDQAIWASWGYTLYKSEDEGVSFHKVADLSVPFYLRMLAKFRLAMRALRLDVRALRVLKSGTVLAVANKRIFRLKNGDLEIVHYFENGLGPLREGLCEDDKGNCYLGEYLMNKKRDTLVNLLKSEDDGQSWKVISSLSNIRHIHCVQYDPFAQRIWLGTGDRDEESSISFSENDGESWTAIGSGDQTFRATALLFTKNYVYWGMDAPTRQNHIYRYNRRSLDIEKLEAVDGPVHYSTVLANGTILFATTAEGASEGFTAEWDTKAHIWASEDGTNWEDIASWDKDFYPYKLVFGRVLFAHGQSGDSIYFTTEALKKVDGKLFKAKIAP